MVSWKIYSCSAGQYISNLCWIRRSIAVFTKAHYWILFWISWIHFTHSQFSNISLNTKRLLSPISSYVSQLVPYFQIFGLKVCLHFSFLCMLHTPPIPSDLVTVFICLLQRYLLRNFSFSAVTLLLLLL
jgi:hypothetical protein